METDVNPKTIKSKTKRRTPCPKGERRNKKTDKCEKYNETKKRTMDRYHTSVRKR